MPDGAEGWLILYSSTSPDGEPVAVSGVVVAPADPPAGPRPVIAWAHGTTGVATGCAPSLSDDPLFELPALRRAPGRGWVVVATDYPGLGTPGQHPYVVGVSEGRAVLDAVRAAGQIDDGPELSSQVAVWGMSQGGHAALFAAQLAPAYAPGARHRGRRAGRAGDGPRDPARARVWRCRQGADGLRRLRLEPRLPGAVVRRGDRRPGRAARPRSSPAAA